MTHAFKDILQRRRQRHVRLARAGYLLKRSSRWLLALAITSLLLIVIAGFAEARRGIDSTFDWPWTWFWDEGSTGWLDRLTGGGERPIAPLTGALLVMFAGGWLTMLGIWLLRTALRIG